MNSVRDRSTGRIYIFLLTCVLVMLSLSNYVKSRSRFCLIGWTVVQPKICSFIVHLKSTNFRLILQIVHVLHMEAVKLLRTSSVTRLYSMYPSHAEIHFNTLTRAAVVLKSSCRVKTSLRKYKRNSSSINTKLHFQFTITQVDKDTYRFYEEPVSFEIYFDSYMCNSLVNPIPDIFPRFSVQRSKFKSLNSLP